jgi:hypothetical protein
MPLPRRSSDDQVTATFLRGLTIGALVGAVLAGSSMLGRRRARAEALAVPETPDPIASPSVTDAAVASVADPDDPTGR